MILPVYSAIMLKRRAQAALKGSGLLKTLILYASKYGTTRKLAKRIAKGFDDATVCNLKDGDIPPVSGFDCVIIGSPVYGGSIQKEAKDFILQTKTALYEKEFGLFLSGTNADDEDKYFQENFPAGVLRAAKATAFLGGIFDASQTGRLTRFIVKRAKQPLYSNTIDFERIKQFIEDMVERYES